MLMVTREKPLALPGENLRLHRWNLRHLRLRRTHLLVLLDMSVISSTTTPCGMRSKPRSGFAFLRIRQHSFLPEALVRPNKNEGPFPVWRQGFNP